MRVCAFQRQHGFGKVEVTALGHTADEMFHPLVDGALHRGAQLRLEGDTAKVAFIFSPRQLPRPVAGECAGTEMNGVEHQFTEEEKNFVVQFAFRSGSKEDTISLIEALAHSVDKAESDEIMVTYRAKYDMKPAWVEQVENLLVALEMYRNEEEKAINHLADILTAYGIDVSAEEIRTTETKTLKTTVREKVEVR